MTFNDPCELYRFYVKYVRKNVGKASDDQHAEKLRGLFYILKVFIEAFVYISFAWFYTNSLLLKMH